MMSSSSPRPYPMKEIPVERAHFAEVMVRCIKCGSTITLVALHGSGTREKDCPECGLKHRMSIRLEAEDRTGVGS